MVTTSVRTNLVTNPKPANASAWRISGGESLAFIADDGGAPALEAVDPVGSGGIYADPNISFSVPLGRWVAVGYDVKALDAKTAANMRLRINGYNGTTVVGGSAQIPVTTSGYTRIATAAQVTEYDAAGWVRTLIWPTPIVTEPGNGFRFREAVVAVAGTEAEALSTVRAYFDGDTPATQWTTYAWTGAANASTSTATTVSAPSIVATVLNSSTEPPPIQLAINDVPPDFAYTVTGIAPGGRTWEVAGGTGVSEGVQVVLIDNRAPVNVPVRYRLVTSTGTYDSNSVTVPWAPANGTGKYLVQSLDGRTIVPIAAWQDNQLPRQPELHSAGFAVRGRRRPVMVLAVAGEGTMSVVWRLSRAASTKLDQIIADGGGIALRTDGTARDLPVSDTAVITSASSALWEADNGVSTDRVWDIELTWIDDPEPSTIPVVWDVGEVDALLANETVGEVDALLAGMTVAQVDALDWGTVTP